MKALDKVFVITGAGNGMGRELALLLLKKGARGVAAVDISEAGLQETVRLAGEYGSKISCHVVNIADRQAVEALPAAVLKAHGQVDGLLNNAGIIQRFVRFGELDYKEIDRVLDVNFWGPIYMIKAFLPHLTKRLEAHIVNTSSMGGFLPVPGQTIYGASKAAIKLFTKGLYAELLSSNVHVTAVFPGAIATNIAANSGVAMNVVPADDAPKEQSFKMTPAPAAAKMIVDGMERNDFQVYVGQDAKMMNLLYRVAPYRAVHMIYSQMKSLLG
jgi:short-subunit dehydrogenase